MYSIRFPKLIIPHSEEKLIEILNLFFSPESERLQMILAEDGDFEFGYFIAQKADAELLIHVCEEFENIFHFEEVSHAVLKGDEQERMRRFFEEHELFIVKKYIEENLTLDDVLDKISSKGIESLQPWDWKILNEASSS